MKPKYTMTVEENIFVAKRNLIDYIWKSAKLEGLGVTYPDTEAIFNGMRAPGVKVSEIVAVNNLKHAWQFLLDHLDVPADYPYICRLNQIVGGDNLIFQAGYLRKIPVAIGGTSWKPELPVETEIKEGILQLLKYPEATDRAISLMLYVMRKQMFLDGNKRTAMLAGNQIMIANGCGIISVPIEQQPKFTELLVRFYESSEAAALKQFIYDNCIDGMDLHRQRDLDELCTHAKSSAATLNSQNAIPCFPNEPER